MAKYECNKCHYVFDEQQAGESFDNLYSCPICDAGKECFIMIEGEEEKPEDETNEKDNDDEEFLFEEAKESEVKEETSEEFQIFDDISEDKKEDEEKEEFEPEGEKNETLAEDEAKAEEERKAKEEEDKKLYEAIFGRPYEDSKPDDEQKEETVTETAESVVEEKEPEAEVKDFIDELLSEDKDADENKESEENRGFVIEKRQEFWKKDDEVKAEPEEKTENVPFSINHTGSVFKVIGADTEYEESSAREEQSTPSGNGLIQTFYTGNSVKSEEELKAEEESKNKENSQEFKPFFGSGMGTIQRVIGAPTGAQADVEEEFVFEDSKEQEEKTTEEAFATNEVVEEAAEDTTVVEETVFDEVEETVVEEVEDTTLEEAEVEEAVSFEAADENITESEESIEQEEYFEIPVDNEVVVSTDEFDGLAEAIEEEVSEEEIEEAIVTEDVGENIDDGFEDDDDGFFFEEAEEPEDAASFEETESVVETAKEPEEEVCEESESNEDEGVVFLNFDEEQTSYIVEDDAEIEETEADDEAEVIDFGEANTETSEEYEEIEPEKSEELADDEAEELHFEDDDEIEDDAEYIDLGQVYMEEQAEKENEESENVEETQIAYSMLKSDMKYTVLYDNEAKKIFDDYPVVNEKVSNGLENIILLPAQCNPLPLDRRANVETKTVIGALTSCPVEVSQPFCFSKLFIWGEHIPNNSRPEEYTNQALVLVKGEEGHIPNLAGKEELREEVAIAKARFHGTPVGLDLVAGRIEADLEACVYAKVDFVILNDVSSRILPYALRRARNYLNRVNSKLEILVCVEALKDAQELAKILALGANFVLVESGFDLDMASEMTEALKEICRSTGHTNVHDLNLEDICTIDTDLAMFTDISHV